MSHPVDIHVGRKLKQIRTLRRLSQTDVARKLNLSFQQIQKYEIGSMECDRKAVADLQDCFTRSEFDCGKIVNGGLSNLNLLPSQIAVLQIDVEGFEKQVLEGFFSEIDDPSHYPPVINFENKILLGRKILQPVYDLLRNKGYSLHEKRTDTLCLLDHKGDTFLDKK